MARSKFRSQNVQNTSASDRFWKLRCQRSARDYGAKRVSKSTCTKHTMLGPLLKVAMSKKCTLLWREAHFEVQKKSSQVASNPRGGLRTQKIWQLFRFWVLKWVLKWYLPPLKKTFKKHKKHLNKYFLKPSHFRKKTMRKSAPPKNRST